MQIATLRKTHTNLKATRKKLEEDYRASTVAHWGFEEEHAFANIDNALPQKNTQLQAIYKADDAVLSNETALKQAETELIALRDEVKRCSDQGPGLGDMRRAPVTQTGFI